MRLKEIKTRNEERVEVNLDAMTSLIKYDYGWDFSFGGFYAPMDVDEGKKLLDEIMKPYVCKNEGDTESRPVPVPTPHQIMVDNNVLDKNHVRYSILSADFLDAEDKLELLVRLGV